MWQSLVAQVHVSKKKMCAKVVKPHIKFMTVYDHWNHESRQIWYNVLNCTDWLTGRLWHKMKLSTIETDTSERSLQLMSFCFNILMFCQNPHDKICVLKPSCQSTWDVKKFIKIATLKRNGGLKKQNKKIVHMISVEMIAVLSWNTPFHITHNDFSL